MSARHFDAIIIGTGPGGEGAAMKLTKSDKRVTVIEKHTDVGGGCTHWGTIPSKALRHAVQQLADYRSDPLFRRLVGPADINYPQLLSAASSVIRQQSTVRENYYHRNKIDIVEGHARFAGEHSIEVARPNGQTEQLTADHFVLAMGSRPYHPPEVDFTHPRVHDSDTIVRPGLPPRSITIYGAGVIGCEYASILATLGLKVNLVNTRSQLLAFLDDEITDALGYHLSHQGVVIRHNEEFEQVETDDEAAVLHCKSGKRFKSDLVLWANGRTGNTQDMGLDEIGIGIDRRGMLEVNENYQTTKPHIYAVGDVVGFPSLASASYDQGRFAATHIVDGKCDTRLVAHIPTGIYTSPEISSLGPNEPRADRAQGPLRGRPGVLSQHRAGADHRAHRRHGQAPVPHRDARDSRDPLLRPAGGRDRAHRSGDHDPAPPRELAQILRRDHVQLPDDGGGLPGRRAERPQPGVLGREDLGQRLDQCGGVIGEADGDADVILEAGGGDCTHHDAASLECRDHRRCVVSGEAAGDEVARARQRLAAEPARALPPGGRARSRSER